MNHVRHVIYEKNDNNNKVIEYKIELFQLMYFTSVRLSLNLHEREAKT